MARALRLTHTEVLAARLLALVWTFQVSIGISATNPAAPAHHGSAAGALVGVGFVVIACLVAFWLLKSNQRTHEADYE